MQMDKCLPQIVTKIENCRDVLFSKAFRIVHGTEYNEVSYDLREKNRGRFFQLYEAVLKETGTWQHLRDEVYPNLARYMKYKSIDLKRGRGVVIAVFFSDHFYLIHYLDFVKAYCEMEDLSENEFHLRVAKWVSRGVP